VRPGLRDSAGFRVISAEPGNALALGHESHGVRVGGGQRAVPLRVGELARPDRQGGGEAGRAAPRQFRGELRNPVADQRQS